MSDKSARKLIEDNFRTILAERDTLRAENARMRARLHAAEQVIEVVRARQVGTAGGVGAAFATYDEVVAKQQASCQT